MTMAQHFTEVERVPTERMSSGIEELDWMYGRDIDSREYGMPRGALALWGGASGVGKTKTCVAICKRLLDMGKTVLYFTLEMNTSQFVSIYCRGIPHTMPFYVSEDKDLGRQIAMIKAHKPDLVIVDSVNEIECYNHGRGCSKIQKTYRDMVEVTRSHVIFITHLNAAGGIKGGTYLPHMGDVVFYLEPWIPEGSGFKISSPHKNRFGKTGMESWWVKSGSGVECTSNHRFNDKDWRSATRMCKYEVRKIREQDEAEIQKAMNEMGYGEEPVVENPYPGIRGFFTRVFNLDNHRDW